MSSGAFGYLGDYVFYWLVYLSLVVHTWCFFRFVRLKMRRGPALMIGNGLIFFCLVGAAALAGESYLRFAGVATDSFGVSLPARRWFALHTRLNSAGFRDVEWDRAKRPGVHRIAFVGDSFTYGWGVENPDDRFPDIIRKRLEHLSPGKFEVLNASKPGWNTADGQAAIRDLRGRYSIDEVVLCHVPNDIEDVIPATAEFDPLHPPEPVFFNVDSSCLLDFLYRRLYLPRLPSVRGYHDWLAEGYASPDIFDKHRKSLTAMAQFRDENGIKLRVVLVPFLKVGGSRLDQAAVHGRMRSVLEALSIEVVDLLEAVQGIPPDELVVSAQDAHPSARAHALFADAVFQAFFSGTNR